MANLYDSLAACFPDARAPFACLPDDSVYSYGDVERWTAQLANELVESGIAPGDRIAVQADKTFDMLMLYLAAIRAGAVFLPLNPAYTPAEIAYFLQDARPSIFVCDSARAESIGAIADNAGACVETMDEGLEGSLGLAARARPKRFETVERKDEDLAAILYTSGTTGRSKGAMVTHGNLASNAFALRDLWRFESGDVLLHALPIFHTHGLFVATNTMMAAGASMQFLLKFEADAVVRTLPSSTVLMGVPTFYVRLLEDPRFDADLTGNMRLFVSGSAPLSAEVHKAFESRTGHAILERYGMTETNINTSNPYDGERRPGTVGFPLTGVDLRIVDPQTRDPCPPGEVGMIEVRGPNVFNGYWRQPRKTAEDLRDGWFVTGDLAQVDADGYLAIVGRNKDLIISGGLNIYPAEVEAALDEIAGVRESAVIAAPHPEWGEGVVAIIALDAGSQLTEEDIATRLKDRLAGFKRPRAMRFVEALPRNSMAKIQKAVLREEFYGVFG